MAANTGARWWEFYFVRYAMGTVIGGVIVYLLLRADPSLSSALLFSKDASLTPTDFALLEAYGLSFCYISSVPILSIYVGRYVDMREFVGKKLNRMQLKIFAAVFLIFSAILFLFQGDYANSLVIYWISGLILAIITALQVGRLIPIFLNPGQLYSYYKKLASQRAIDNGTCVELIESYRHIREHGNSIVIVLLEIVLALVLGGLGYGWRVPTGLANNTPLLDIMSYATVVFIWIIPGALVWIVGLSLERQFWRDTSL